MKKTYKSLYKSHINFLKYCLEKSHLSHQYLKNIKQSGDDIESEIRNIIRQIIPERFKITHGYIINALNQKDEPKKSPQCDLIIVDTLVPHRLFTVDQKTKAEIVPVEAVVGVIEIKRTLNKKSLKDALEHINNIRKSIQIRKDDAIKFLPGGISLGKDLNGGYYSNPMLGVMSVLSSKSFGKKENLKKELEINIQTFREAQIDLICSFDNFLFTTRDEENERHAKPLNLRPEKVNYTFFELINEEKLTARILGFISAYIQSSSGRQLNQANYFFNDNI